MREHTYQGVGSVINIIKQKKLVIYTLIFQIQVLY